MAMVSDIVDRSIAMAACIAVFDSLPGPTAFLASLFARTTRHAARCILELARWL